MAYHDDLRDLFRKQGKEIKRIQEQQKITQEELRACCPHTYIAETDYVSSDYGASLPPRRICEICGFEEDGWGSGYKVLKTSRPRIVGSRDAFYRLRSLDFEIEV